MERTPHAFDFLSTPPDELPAVCVLFGDESFLKQLCLREIDKILQDDDDDFPATQLEGAQLTWIDVADELATASLFGPEKRTVILRRADEFVSKHRSQLEDYASSPSRSSTLILDVKTFPGNTRLAKMIADSGIVIACKPPERKSGKSKSVDTTKLNKWITSWAKKEHGLKLKSTATQQLLDLVGMDIGKINQDLAKLALSVEDPKAEVSPETVVEIVGGWRTRTTWDLLDAACDGNAAEALVQLDRMLMSGEHPQALFGAFSWSLRRFAAATRAVQSMENEGRRPNLGEALLSAGFRKYPQGALKQAENQLRQIGRDRAGKLYAKLLEADLQLKGTHSQPHRARHAMEMLLVGLSNEADARQRR